MGRFARLCLAAVSCTLAAALVPGCTTEQPTQIVVSVNTDLSLGSDVDELRLDIRRQDDEGGDFVTVEELREPLAAGDGLPLTLALTRAEHGSNTVKVTAEGWLGNTLVVRRIAVAHFVTGRVLSLPVNLVSVCRDRFAGCEQQPELTCGDQGMCEAIERTKLDAWGGPPPFEPGEHDAGADAGATDAGGDGSLGEGDRVVQLALGDRHSCALWASGAVQCWGGDEFRQLSSQVDECPGEDDAYRCPYPRQLRMPDAVSLSAGDLFNCAALTNGTTVCWGSDELGSLGDGDPTDADGGLVHVPQQGEIVPVQGMENAEFVEAGGQSVCANGPDTSHRCWGNNGDAQLRASSDPPFFTSSAKSDRPTGDSTLSLGQDFGCSLSSGAVVCWGDDTLGQGGEDQVMPSSEQVPITGNARSVVAGGQHACATLNTSEVRCWGRNDYSQVGVSPTDLTTTCTDDTLTRACATTAQPVSGDPRASALALGGLFSCLITDDADAQVKCWGDNRNGIIDPSNGVVGVTRPIAVQGLKHVRLIAAGKQHACAVTSSNQVWCWGSNEDGQLGPNALRGADASAPVRVDLPPPSEG